MALDLNLFKSTFRAASLRVVAAGVAFVASIIYARYLGPERLGQYALVLAWVSILTISSALGLPQYLLREASKGPGTPDIHRIRAWADRRILISGSLACLVLLFLGTRQPQTATLFYAASLVPLLNALSEVRVGLLQARGLIVQSQWPTLLLSPAVTAIGALVVWHTSDIEPTIALVCMTAFGSLLAVAANQSHLSTAYKSAPEAQPLELNLGTSLPFLLLGSLFLINSRIDILMLGAIATNNEAGLYVVASRFAEFVAFILIASNMVISPIISRLHHCNKTEELQRTLTTAARLTFAASFPVAVTLILLAEIILRFVYGPAYAGSATTLRILAAGQAISLMAGFAGITLNMTGSVKYSVYSFFIGATLNITLNVILIPSMGAAGAATASSFSLVISNMLRWHFVRTKVKLNPSIFRA